jgi:hypothetical protein
MGVVRLLANKKAGPTIHIEVYVYTQMAIKTFFNMAWFTAEQLM